MNAILVVARREFASYFSSALAVVFIGVFVAANGAATFFVSDFFGRGQADLTAFFSFHPWLLAVLMPAIAMRLWAEERRAGTLEFLVTLPVSMWQLVLGKFLAGWSFAALALAMTVPIWIAVNYLGEPDNGVILASYVGSLLMAGAYLALSCCISALTSNVVTAFVLSVAASVLMLLTTQEPILALLPSWAAGYVTDLASGISFARHFDAITRGVLELQDVLFFVSFTALLLFLNCQVLEARRDR